MTDRGADGARLRCDMLVPCHAGDDYRSFAPRQDEKSVSRHGTAKATVRQISSEEICQKLSESFWTKPQISPSLRNSTFRSASGRAPKWLMTSAAATQPMRPATPKACPVASP